MKKTLSLIMTVILITAALTILLTSCKKSNGTNTASGTGSSGVVGDVVSGTESIAGGVVSGTESIVGGVVSGTESIVGGAASGVESIADDDDNKKDNSSHNNQETAGDNGKVGQ